MTYRIKELHDYLINNDPVVKLSGPDEFLTFVSIMCDKAGEMSVLLEQAEDIMKFFQIVMPTIREKGRHSEWVDKFQAFQIDEDHSNEKTKEVIANFLPKMKDRGFKITKKDQNEN